MLSGNQEVFMSERALAFLEGWVTEHIHADDNGRAKQLAEQCLVAAKVEGIPNAEIDEAVDDLTAFMSGQIEEAAEREVHRLAEKDRS
jgi:hypothetical protein